MKNASWGKAYGGDSLGPSMALALRALQLRFSDQIRSRRKTAVLIAQEISLANHGGSAGLRDHGLLQSALARPRKLYEYSKPGLPEWAAAYMADIIKNHPFVDGNKRAGFLAGAAFLELNGLRLVATEPEATQMIPGLASGEVTEVQWSDWLQENSIRACSAGSA